MPKFGTKNALFVIFEISTLEFVKNKFLTHTFNFCIESIFSIGPCPLYKVYPQFVH